MENELLLSHAERAKLHADIERLQQVLETEPNDFEDEFETHSASGGPAASLFGVAGLSGQHSPASFKGSDCLPRKGPAYSTGTRSNTATPSFVNELAGVQFVGESEGVVQDDSEETEELPVNSAVALALNHAYQEVIEENLKRVKLVLVHNRERQSLLEQVLESKSTNEVPYTNDAHRKKDLHIYAVPYFKDADGMHPPPNEDTVFKKQFEVDPFLRPARTFARDELAKLKKCVTADAKHKLMIPILHKKEIKLEKINRLTSAETERKEELDQEVDQLDTQILELKQLELQELIELRGNAAGDIDWMKIANMDFGGNRTADELERAWVQFAHPSINMGKFRSNEDSRLLAIAQKYNFKNWIAIANELDTNRTPFQCLQRYQMKLNPVLKTGKWTIEEDAVLKDVVEQCRLPGGDIDWNNVCSYMEGRSYEQCQLRYKAANLGVPTKKGRWTQEEDAKLLSALQIYGTQWAKLEEFVPNRTQVQIRERYHTRFKNFKHGNWSYDEDRYIWLKVMQLGVGNWALISKGLPGRSDSSIRLRYIRLHKWNQVCPALGATKPENLEVLFKAPVSSMRKEITRNSLSKRVSKKVDKKEPADPDFLDKTLMFNEALQKGKVTKEEIEDKPDIVHAVAQQYQNKDKLVVEKPALSTEEKVRNQLVQKKVEEDIKNGIYIPRPPPDIEDTRAYNSLIAKKISVQEMIKSKINNSLVADGYLNEVPLVSQSIDSLLQDGSEDMTAVDMLKLKSLGKMLTVKEILNLTSTIKNTALETHGLEPVNSYVTPSPQRVRRDSELNFEIGKLYAEKSEGYRPGNLSKKILPNVERPERSKDIEGQISKLIFAALNIDVNGAISNAEMIRKGQIPDFWTSKQPYENNLEKIESNINKLEVITMKPITKAGPVSPPHKLLRMLLKTPQGAATNTTEPPRAFLEETPECSNSESTNKSRKSLPRRRAWTGEQASMYKLPPLPPTYSSLAGFKKLLLQRKKLITVAGKYHIPGSLTTGKTSTAAENVDSTGQLKQQQQESEDVDDSASVSTQASFLPQTVTGADVDRTAEKKGSFITKDLLTAKRVIDTDHTEELQKGNMALATFHEISEGTVEPRVLPKPKARALEKLRKTHDYQNLWGRFRSLFLWPALLSTIPVEQVYCVPRRIHKPQSSTSQVRKGRKRKYTNNIVKKEGSSPKDEEVNVETEEDADDTGERKRGRPKGSKNKEKNEGTVPPKRRSLRQSRKRSFVMLEYDDDSETGPHDMEEDYSDDNDLNYEPEQDLEEQKTRKERVKAYLKDYRPKPKKKRGRYAKHTYTGGNLNSSDCETQVQASPIMIIPQVSLAASHNPLPASSTESICRISTSSPQLQQEATQLSSHLVISNANSKNNSAAIESIVFDRAKMVEQEGNNRLKSSSDSNLQGDDEVSDINNKEASVISSSIQNTDNSVQNTDNSVQNTDNSVQNTDNSVQNTDNSVQNTDNSVQNTDNSVQNTDNSVQQQSLVPCILIGEKLIPINHPLIGELIKTLKSNDSSNKKDENDKENSSCRNDDEQLQSGRNGVTC